MKTLTLSGRVPPNGRYSKRHGVLSGLVVLAVASGCDSGAGNSSSPGGGDSGPPANTGGSPGMQAD